MLINIQVFEIMKSDWLSDLIYTPENWVLLGWGVAGAAAVLSCVRVAAPNQALVKTGWLVGSRSGTPGLTTRFPMSVHKRTVALPLVQSIHTVNLTPRTYEFDLHNMSSGKVEFKLPVAFTIGPVSPAEEEDGFRRYAERMLGVEDKDMTDIIKGIIEGETRGLTATLSVEEMFAGKDLFRERVVARIQEDLSQFGLKIYNANIKEMADYDNQNKYFAYRKQRAIETANYEAQVDVAHAKMEGSIGVATREKEQRARTAELSADARVAELLQQQRTTVAAADLGLVEADNDRRLKTAQYEATNAAELRRVELERGVHAQRNLMEIERQRADALSTAKVEAEAQEARAAGEAAAILRVAEARAAALQLLAGAQSKQLREVSCAADGNAQLAQFYLGLQEGLPQEMARQAAQAVQGMQPKLNVWEWDGANKGDSGVNSLLKVAAGVAHMIQGAAGNQPAGNQPTEKTMLTSSDRCD